VVEGGLPPAPASPGHRAAKTPPGDILGDRPEDLELCRSLADRVRDAGYVGLRAPSAADPEGVAFVLFPENRPAGIELQVVEGPIAFNHGRKPFVDARGFPTRDRP
jgi:hypothetical protein